MARSTPASADREPDFDAMEVMEQLFQLADELRRAQAQAAGAELRTLTTQRREAAARRVEEARAAVDAAAATLGDRERELEAARTQHQRLRDQMEQLHEQLRQLQREIASAGQAELAATRHRDDAQRADAAARRALEQAEAELRELSD